MKILALAWEFPPRIVGGIARHVAELYPELVKLGHEIHLLTIEFGQAPAYEEVAGVYVHRVPVAGHPNFWQWVGNMNESMGRHGGKLLNDSSFDLIHAHDWLVGDAAIALKHLFKTPLVATIHATECGRHNGIHTDIQRYIHGKETHLAHEAWRVIVCTNYMRLEIERIFQCPWNKIDVVYNGIYAQKKQRHPDFDYWQFRRRFAADCEKIVYYVGRMTHEKGVQVLLNAAPRVLRELNGTVKFVMIGGGNTDSLKRQASSLGIWDKCYFTGFMSDSDLDKFQTIADCAVFPSLYEPFGIVALESFAARVPVVVSDAGGLPEVVRHSKTGIVTQAGNADSVRLGHPRSFEKLHLRPLASRKRLRRPRSPLRWDKLAQQTEAVFGRVLHERSQVKWL
jgi:glycosyltransferase involved in cell wall biosynthesis